MNAIAWCATPHMRAIYFLYACHLTRDRTTNLSTRAARRRTACPLRTAEAKDSTIMKQRQWILSIAVFVLIIGALVSVDERVRNQFEQLVSGGGGVSSWDNRLMDLGAALVAAVRHQSIDNAPLMVFATVGALLFIFMVRT
jgi:hypothetical protein